MLVVTRQLGLTERYFLRMRGERGCADPFLLVNVDGTSTTPISDANVCAAWAALRLRHPLLAARIVPTGSTYEFAYAPPTTAAHALRQVRAQLEFVSVGQDGLEGAADALRARWGGVDPSETIDLRDSTCTVAWYTNDAGKYLLGLQASHTVADAFGLLGLARQLLELLSVHGAAEREILQHVASPRGVARPLEEIIPGPEQSSEEDQETSRRTYDKLMAPSLRPRFGLNPDGQPTESIAVTRVVRHTWLEDETKAILRACKAHGVTVTQVCSAALILTAIRYGPKVASGSPAGGQGDANLYFKVHLPIDLLSRAPDAPNGQREAAVRVGHYPTFLSVPRAAADEGQDGLYELARQVKDRHTAFVDSPWFWHFIRYYLADSHAILDAALDAAAKPEAANAPPAAFLPLLSSLGDWSKKLPAEYDVKAKEDGEAGQLRVADVALHLKVIPDTPCLHLWTYGGKMNFQLTHNIMHTSAALMDPFFESFIKTVSDVGRV